MLTKGCIHDKELKNTCNYFLMFSDGIHSFGPKKTQTHLNIPTHTICTSSQADHTALKNISMHSGGLYFSLKSTGDVTQIVEVSVMIFDVITSLN